MFAPVFLLQDSHRSMGRRTTSKYLRLVFAKVFRYTCLSHFQPCDEDTVEMRGASLATDWEQTFRNWSKPSSDSECEKQENAERMIGDAICESNALQQRDIKIVPQGSYRNNTNVRQESDVDICICCMHPFFADYTFADYGQGDVGNVDDSSPLERTMLQLRASPDG